MPDNDQIQAADPEQRAVSGHPDTPPQQPDHRPQNDEELLEEGGKPQSDGKGKTKDTPGTTLPGYG